MADLLKQARAAVAPLLGGTFSQGKEEDGKVPENVLTDLIAPRSIAGERRRVALVLAILSLVLVFAVFSKPVPSRAVTGVVSRIEVTNKGGPDRTAVLMEEERRLREAIAMPDEGEVKKESKPGEGTQEAAAAKQLKERAVLVEEELKKAKEEKKAKKEAAKALAAAAGASSAPSKSASSQQEVASQGNASLAKSAEGDAAKDAVVKGPSDKEAIPKTSAAESMSAAAANATDLGRIEEVVSQPTTEGQGKDSSAKTSSDKDKKGSAIKDEGKEAKKEKKYEAGGKGKKDEKSKEQGPKDADKAEGGKDEDTYNENERGELTLSGEEDEEEKDAGSGAGKEGKDEESEDTVDPSDFEKDEASSADDVTTGDLTKDDEEAEKLVAQEDAKEAPPAPVSQGPVSSEDAAAKIVAATAEAVARDPVQAADPVQCRGKTVYIYPLPARFNRALVEQCQTLLPWYNMCPHFLNHGLGKVIKSSTFMKPAARWFETHSYALEMVFHYHLRRAYSCITNDPEQADMFYVPFYASLDVMRWHYRKDATLEATNHLSHSLIRWLKKHSYFRRYNGSDHVMVLGKVTWDFRRLGNSTWGNDFLLQSEMAHVTRLLLEANEWDGSDVAVPHLTYFHPRQENDLGVWQKEVQDHERTILVSFAALRGMYPPAKDALAKQCQNEPRSCRFMDCQDDICNSPEAVLGLYIDSHFCLLPPGYESVRRAPFDSMLAGCIPVFFDNFFLKQYKWHLPADPNLYSVHFNEADVVSGKVNVVQELSSLSMVKIRKLRNSMIQTVLPGLLYNHPKAKPMFDHEDAFDITMDHLLKRIKRRKAPFLAALQKA